MTKDELITKQQILIEELKEEIADNQEAFRDIYGYVYACGAPLNDNIHGYSKEQRVIFHRIGGIVKDLIHDDND